MACLASGGQLREAAIAALSHLHPHLPSPDLTTPSPSRYFLNMMLDNLVKGRYVGPTETGQQD